MQSKQSSKNTSNIDIDIDRFEKVASVGMRPFFDCECMGKMLTLQGKPKMDKPT